MNLVGLGHGKASRKPYPSDVSDDEWAFVAPYLALLPPEAGQRRHDLREVFNAVRYLVRTGAPWRSSDHFPPWAAVHQQTQRWLAAAVQEVTGDSVEVAFVDQGYTGESRGRRRGARHPLGGGEVAGGQARLRPAAPALGGGALVLPGRRGSAAWLGTTNGCRKRWRACISSPSPA